MKLYLFGGCETNLGQAPTLKAQFNKILSDLQPTQLLHIPYARTIIPEDEADIWGEGWMSRDLDLGKTELLDARKKEDLEKAVRPVVFINGGPQDELMYEFGRNKKLLDLVMNAEYIIGESAGSAVTGFIHRVEENGETIIENALGIVKDTLIIPHYGAWNRRQLLIDTMKETKVPFGIGIDSLSAVVIDTGSYPDKFEKIGDGLIEFIKQEDLT